MFQVNSKKTLHRLSDRSLKDSRMRNLIAITAIALTTILFTTLFTIGSGMIESIQMQTMRQAGGDGMGVFKYITDEEYNRLKEHKLIKEISYNRVLCDSVDNPELLKRHGELYYMDDTGIKLGFCEPVAGSKPLKANEIMMDTTTMQLLGIKQEIGAPVSLLLTVHGKEVTRNFVLSGWWEADPVFNASIMVTSRAYVDTYIEELYNSYKEDFNMTGVINSYVMFANSLNLQGKMEQIITESGYSIDEDSPNAILYNENWAYLSGNFGADPMTVMGVLAAAALIIFTGYLIIYNIFQISVMKDIHFYGLLKTIGTTGKQLKKIIHRQALVLAGVGIPIGLIIGYFLGKSLIPVIMSISSIGSYETHANPFIFTGSAAFALITVAISTAKPGKIAAQVSPVEAVRYTDSDVKTTAKTRKSRNGAKIYRMALANLGRNRKRTVIVIVSMSLSLVLFYTIYSICIGFDMDKYLSTFVDTDYLIAHAQYFNNAYTGPGESLSEEMIEEVKSQEGFEEGGRIYASIRGAELFTVEKSDETQDYYAAPDGNPFAHVYGLENLPLARLTVLEGSIDYDRLQSGDYILEGVDLDDYHEPKWETSHYEIGDKVTLHVYRGNGESADENEYITKEYTVMAKVAMKYYVNTCRYYAFEGGSFYLPAGVYKTLLTNPGVMSYSFNVADDQEEEMEAFLQNYTTSTEPIMGYTSKYTQEKEFIGMKNMVLMVGGILSFIIGLIGILNFINSMLTGILARRREFAMLQSIGMTSGQLRGMLIAEGFYYTLAAAMTAIVLGVAMSLLFVRVIVGNLWFFSYRFTMMPLFMVIPVLMIIGICLPMLAVRTIERQSIVDRLRDGE